MHPRSLLLSLKPKVSPDSQAYLSVKSFTKNKTAEHKVPQTPSHQAGKYQGKEESTKGVTTSTPQATGSHSLGAAIWLWNHLLPQFRLELQTPAILNQCLLIYWLRGSFVSLHCRDKYVQWTSYSNYQGISARCEVTLKTTPRRRS